MVSLETRVTWKPYGKCVVQAYRQANLVGEAGKQSGVPPGTVRIADLTHGNTGRTELKIWAVGGAAPPPLAPKMTTTHSGRDGGGATGYTI
jgi:hypothetical protein